MSCKNNFSMFDDIQENMTPMHLTPLPDQMKEIIKEKKKLQVDFINFDILLNKFLNNQQITDVQLQQLSQQQRIVLQCMKKKSQMKSKRPDECQKLFYKKGFKFAQSQFFKKRKCKSRKMAQFYHNYFDKTSKRCNLPITSFYHPDKKTKPGLQVGFKTFNITYIRLLLKSKQFRQIIKIYHKYFLQQCLKERRKKLNSFSTSLKKIMSRSQDDPRLLIQYLQSGQCKIPWTLQEMKQAQQISYEQLIKIQINQPDDDNLVKKGPDIQIFEKMSQLREEEFEQSQSEQLFQKLLKQ